MDLARCEIQTREALGVPSQGPAGRDHAKREINGGNNYLIGPTPPGVKARADRLPAVAAVAAAVSALAATLGSALPRTGLVDVDLAT